MLTSTRVDTGSETISNKILETPHIFPADYTKEFIDNQEECTNFLKFTEKDYSTEPPFLSHSFLQVLVRNAVSCNNFIALCIGVFDLNAPVTCNYNRVNRNNHFKFIPAVKEETYYGYGYLNMPQSGCLKIKIRSQLNSQAYVHITLILTSNFDSAPLRSKPVRKVQDAFSC
ncbi:hypothetical protein DAPPUDRAFT_246715 [Daphnia pulex]|uniref:Uncharacterized protein n=1 Tax=Daphnia pulex TaxID=6669 RepID=E9GR36_DAPPU|nr:hypothetical protein DAPPUDRAFT_246715 [Daphnia pulex]|eukprot:EFX77942.1 hypothetical protein DAPPUDRAFT_246715 [Daphnia pulex]